jgi:molybdate transport system ATP-binding protein
MPEWDGGLRFQGRQARPIALDAELACDRGQLLALVGPSGSGKTTVLRCIAGLHRPLHGSVSCGDQHWYDSARAVHVPPQSRRVGMLFQHYALFPHLSAQDNVAAALSHLPHRERATRARDWLARVHLEGMEKRRPATLSGGQQQRVALARALAREPLALLLDEPFSAVDQVTRRKLVRELAQMRADLRMPIVLVTHDLTEARMLADVMCIIHHGKTLQSAPPEEMLTRPANVQVARQVDIRNLFEGRVAGHDIQTGTTWLEWRGRRLEARHRPGLAIGAPVAWMIPTENVVLHRRDRPSRGDHENPVSGTLSECLFLGETLHAVLQPDGGGYDGITFSVPAHVARRNGLATGVAATISLLKEAIHLMPPESDTSARLS